MSSSEMSSDEEFHKEVESGQTKPAKIGNLSKGDYILIKGYPCKIIEVTKSKPGKHGHAKANVTATDIFTGKKYEDSESTGHTVSCPIVEKQEHDLVDIDEDGRVFYLKDDNTTGEDVTMDNSSDLYKEIYEEFKEKGQDLLVSIVSAMGKKAVVSYRKDNNQIANSQ